MWVIWLLSLVSGLHGVSVVSVSRPVFSDSRGNCQLPVNLRQEIAAYRPIVNQIVKAIVDGPYAGDTWLR